jgi:hypothetical protein
MEDNIKMGLKVVESESANCIQVTQDRDKWKAIVNAVTNIRSAPTAENYLTRWGTIRLTKRRAVCTWNVWKIISVLSIHGLTSTSASTTMASILRTHSTLIISHLCPLDSKRIHVSSRRQQAWLNFANAAAKWLKHCDQACHRNTAEKLPHEHGQKSITLHLPLL